MMINSQQSRLTIACNRWWRYFGTSLLQFAMVLCVVTLLQGETLSFSNSPASMLLPCKAQQKISWYCAHPPDQNMAFGGFHLTTKAHGTGRLLHIHLSSMDNYLRK